MSIGSVEVLQGREGQVPITLDMQQGAVSGVEIELEWTPQPGFEILQIVKGPDVDGFTEVVKIDGQEGSAKLLLYNMSNIVLESASYSVFEILFSSQDGFVGIIEILATVKLTDNSGQLIGCRVESGEISIVPEGALFKFSIPNMEFSANFSQKVEIPVIFENIHKLDLSGVKIPFKFSTPGVIKLVDNDCFIPSKLFDSINYSHNLNRVSDNEFVYLNYCTNTYADFEKDTIGHIYAYVVGNPGDSTRIQIGPDVIVNKYGEQYVDITQGSVKILPEKYSYSIKFVYGTKGKVIPNVQVSLNSGKKAYQNTSNQNGIAEFHLPVGDYNISYILNDDPIANTAFDMSLYERYMTQLISLDQIGLITGDVDFDKKLTPADLSEMALYIGKINDSLNNENKKFLFLDPNTIKIGNDEVPHFNELSAVSVAGEEDITEVMVIKLGDASQSFEP